MMLEEQAQARLTFFTQGLDLLTYFSRNFFLGGVSPCQTLPNFVLQSLPDLLLQFPCSGLVIKPQLKDNICLLVGPGPKCQDVEKMLTDLPFLPPCFLLIYFPYLRHERVRHEKN